jgi:hypothetical protein
MTTLESLTEYNFGFELAQSINGMHWIEKILEERFGHVWRLSEYEKGVKLSLNGADGSIFFDTGCDSFARAGSSEFPCSFWDAENEGWESVLGKTLPAPGALQISSPLIEKNNADHVIHYDILALVYWMLARVEEIGREDLDAHDRFPATSSHAYKNGYLERPIIDEWLHVLGQVIQRQWPSLILKNHSFNMKVSHDVDQPSRSGFLTKKQLIRAVGHHAIKKRDLGNALNSIRVGMNSKKILHPSDPFNTFDWIMDLSEEQGLRSAFYFIVGNNDPHDADYHMSHPAIRALMNKIDRRGHESGLHPSYVTYDKPDTLAYEADYFRQICAEEDIKLNGLGGRMHYLRWCHPATMMALERTGFTYDSSLGYADSAGFRCGTCFEYPGFNPVSQEALSLRIRPLIAMECSVMDLAYMGLGNGPEALEKFVSLKNTCRAVGGTFTLLWHNSSIPGNKNLYRNVLIA